MSSSELSGKVAIVTGAGKNIGRAIALSLAAEGATVAVNTRESRADAENVVKEIRAAGGKAEVFMADVADGAAVQAMVDGVAKQFGRLDMLVLNAAYRNEVPFIDMGIEDWRRVMSTTLDGTFYSIKAALPHMIASGGGNIITLGGAKALSASPHRVHVATAKHGLVGLTRTLAKELAEYGIRVNCVSPGPIDTSRPLSRTDAKTPAKHIPVGRLGVPDDIAAMVRFLCCDSGSFITGQTLHVNGGTQI
jgi:3-oxoacyl-[acyl-carrier protein] reductase